MRKRKRRRRWFWLFPPLLLAAKAAAGALKALRGGDEKLLVADRKVAEAAPYHRQRRVVQVSAGIPITTTVFVPSGKGPFPAIIMVHSWMWWRIQCDFLYAPSFARRGYVVLTYDCRGWGSSGGEVSCAAPDREMVDLEDLITWLSSPEAGIPVDPERIGITGTSYGGGHSFLIAARDKRIKAAAPMNGWTDLNSSLMPNGCWKAFWSIFLFLGSTWALKFNPKNDLVRWLKTVAKDRNLSRVEQELRERSAIHEVKNVDCPMFIVHSWNDDLFEPNQILKYYQELEVPKRLYITNGLHGFDPGRGDLLFPNAIWDEVRRWFDRWLKGDGGEEKGQESPVSYYQPWDRRMMTADEWPPENVNREEFFLRGDHPQAVNSGCLEDIAPDDHEPSNLLINNTVANGQWSGPPAIRWNVIRNLPIPGVPISLPGDSASFTTSMLPEEAVMVGAPAVELYVSSSTGECQLNAFLYDVSPRGFCRLVTHCAAMRDDMEPEGVARLSFDLIACAHRFPAGHRIRLVVCASDPLYVMPSRVPSIYHLFHTAEHPSRLTLPIMEGAGE